MILRELELKDQKAFLELLENWDGASGFNMLYDLIAEMDFSSYLNILRESKEGVNLPEGNVPSTSLFAFKGSEIIGKVSIRHTLNQYLENAGGHIGYGVLPNYRGQGYATQMLRESLRYCQKLGLKKVLVTCDETNLGSVKVIEKNGGVFENFFDPKDTGPRKMRFWITFPSS